MPVAAAVPGGPDSASSATTVGISELVEVNWDQKVTAYSDSVFQVLAKNVFNPIRSPEGPFLFSVDHCFSIRGQGTIMTGTVLSGSVKVTDVSISS